MAKSTPLRVSQRRQQLLLNEILVRLTQEVGDLELIARRRTLSPAQEARLAKLLHFLAQNPPESEL